MEVIGRPNLSIRVISDDTASMPFAGRLTNWKLIYGEDVKYQDLQNTAYITLLPSPKLPILCRAGR